MSDIASVKHSVKGFLPKRTFAEKGQPYLFLGTTTQYQWIYDDSGSGSHGDVSLFRPTPNAGSYIISDYAQGSYGSPSSSILTVSSVNDPDNTLLQAPVDYNLVWTDQGSGGHNDGSIWYPVPPDNFVSIGFVAQSGYDKPAIASYRCVHHSLLQPTTTGTTIWSDQGSGAHGDVALYQVTGDLGVFVAQGNYSPFAGTVYSIKTS